MKISTSLSMWVATTCTDLDLWKDVITRCRNSGYDTGDIGFGGCGILAEDNWREKIETLAEYCRQVDLKITQSHLPFYVPERIHAENQEGDPVYFNEMLRRGIEAAGILGASWTVYHPINALENDRSPDVAMELNRSRLVSLLDVCRKWNVGIAVENMMMHPQYKPLRRFGVTPEELRDLVDAVNDPLVGICWDTGHANLLGLDQLRSLRVIGKRLKAVHIQDNRGFKDDHLAPFMGDIDWTKVMTGLKEIGYEGDLHFETFGPTRVPQLDLKDELAKMLYKVGEELMTLA